MIEKNNNTFHLQGKNISYIIVINNTGDLLHYYFGSKLHNREYSKNKQNNRHSLICRDSNNKKLKTHFTEFSA